MKRRLSDPPVIQKKSISRGEIENMSDEELLKHIHGEDSKEGFVPVYTQMALISEYNKRERIRLSKPHWTLNWSFVLLIVSVVVSLVSLWISLSAI